MLQSPSAPLASSISAEARIRSEMLGDSFSSFCIAVIAVIAVSSAQAPMILHPISQATCVSA
jgi:hypothetical protein